MRAPESRYSWYEHLSPRPAAVIENFPNQPPLAHILRMHASDIRARFLAYFARQDHAVRPSSSLVPGDDPTLLFTNAGMVQLQKVFLGLEAPPEGKRRATTAQKCVRAGGKHNDLEQDHPRVGEQQGRIVAGDER